MDQSQSQNQNQPNRRSDDTDRPTQMPNREPAEGPREKTESGQPGGITNRPLDREQQEQREVPDRGKTKEEDDPTVKTKI